MNEKKSRNEVLNASAPIFPRPTEALAVPETEASVRKFNTKFCALKVFNYVGINTQLKFASLHLSLFSLNFN